MAGCLIKKNNNNNFTCKFNDLNNSLYRFFLLDKNNTFLLGFV